jgi:metal-responsive CopG/Arc/MetJ family transcriptional regulator
MSETSRGERLQIMLTEDELRALDDWRFTRRMPSRAAAVRELLRRGLAAEGALLDDGRIHSKDFGVVDHIDGGNGLDGAEV